MLTLQKFANCCRNYLTGNNTLATEILDICENIDRPSVPVYSTGNAMTIRFVSNFFSARGFRLSVSAPPDAYLLAKYVCN